MSMDFKRRNVCGCNCFSEAESVLVSNNICVISTRYTSTSVTNFLPSLCYFYFNVAHIIHHFSIPCLTKVFSSRAERVNLLGFRPEFTKGKNGLRIKIVSWTFLLIVIAQDPLIIIFGRALLEYLLFVLLSIHSKTMVRYVHMNRNKWIYKGGNISWQNWKPYMVGG